MEEGELLRKENIDKIRSIPCVIVQGRYDCVCPATTASVPLFRDLCRSSLLRKVSLQLGTSQGMARSQIRSSHLTPS
jgi:hypothetical protein